ncbi:ubiquitin-conjugating enzyme E2 H isoform X3 [Talpa occidentalis]|nr:ubiquitin-conjugating enzyme E2 H isoform X3 [Talpa occidentalis]XP_054548636.1 ubiquitin-conjugating enzyme E2 H isoform X3 [Talpa occidentalis]XP_054548637.1 ubiquitin-conjugating enzyme E2 H isoform X3 [Talpa occidentalis]XP_054548638.1 ubiquitin-conjugating enzyme E2 H isoform X3 [Talpa occidentalis]XP_054548639.1 ubiquitin-conjugating enzyme E2 H isoform X3 [Talpa occidentalis]XP_054548640.1 ubiquitin-conjugating enzyme E2 H isoform X3 [Talpa occidentalis]XP_054548641.1 ubiquitin-conj
MNKIFHPNIDEASGTVCLDVINQTWTALYDEEIEMQRGRDLPKVKKQVSGRPEIRLWSSKFFICCSSLRSQLPSCLEYLHLEEVIVTSVCGREYRKAQDLTNIFESFLPQLLAYPNPIDPLNGDAAAMYLHRPEEYKQKIKEYIQKYATEEALKEQEEGTGDSSSESSMSDFSEDEAQDMEL